MAPRGTRRPHAKRVRAKARKPSRSSGGGKKGGICDMVVLAPASCLVVLPLALALLVTR